MMFLTRVLLILIFSFSFLFSKDIYFEGGKINLEDLAITVSLETKKDIILHESLKDKIVYLRVGKVISTNKLFNYFKALLDANGLALNKRDGFYIVTPITDLSFFSYRFKHRDTKDFEIHLEKYKDFCSVGKKMLYCLAVPKTIKVIKKMVKSFDIPKPVDPFKNKTVDIRVKIIESNYNDLQRLKSEFSFIVKSDVIQTGITSKESFRAFLNMFLNGASVVDTLSLKYYFDLLEKNDISKVMNEPRVLVTNGFQTTIISGGTTRVISSTVKNDNLSATTTQYEQMDLGLQFSVKADIVDDNTCTLTISLNNEGFIGGTAELPITSRQSYTTTLTIKKNETIIIGGVIYKKNIDNSSNTPFLSDIPVLGNLFKSSEKSQDKKVLTIALTIKDFK